jgi:thymidylate synthase (FAD)
MKITRAAYEILTPIDKIDIYKKIERAGRICYKSEDKITDDSCIKFVQMIMDRNHESVIEHVSLSVKFVTDRAIANELVRHRLASYSQESTRYINYGSEKFDSEITVIAPHFISDDDINKYNKDILTYGQDVVSSWFGAMEDAEHAYISILECGFPPEDARSVLPLSLKTEIIMTCNLREWKHVFNQRTSSFAHTDMVMLMWPLLKEVEEKLPEIFKKED